jgi:hypothetical protein
MCDAPLRRKNGTVGLTKQEAKRETGSKERKQNSKTKDKRQEKGVVANVGPIVLFASFGGFDIIRNNRRVLGKVS